MSYTEGRSEAFAFEHGFESDPAFSICALTYSLVTVTSPDGLGANHDFIEIVGNTVEINALLDKLDSSYVGKQYEFEIRASML